jgi:RHS repeat-associated protein
LTSAISDALTGLQYNSNRWYDPVMSRWISQDPIGIDGVDYNFTRYVGNDPTDGIDPSGLKFHILPIAKFSRTTSGGQSYSGKTAQQLLDALNQIAVNGDTISNLSHRGHGNGTSIVKNSDESFMEIPTNDDGSPKNWNKVRCDSSAGQTNILQQLKNTTDKNTTIILGGCSTAQLAKNLADLLHNGTSVTGTLTPVWPAPTSNPWYIGPWWTYRNMPE